MATFHDGLRTGERNEPIQLNLPFPDPNPFTLGRFGTEILTPYEFEAVREFLAQLRAETKSAQ